MSEPSLFDQQPDEPSLPYAGTSGWSGSDTSKERAVSNDKDGTTARRQNQVLVELENVGSEGLTWHDVAKILGVHHGSASGVLSVLHKDGRIARLTESRNRSKIYVLPKYVYGRPTEIQGRKIHTCPNCGIEVA